MKKICVVFAFAICILSVNFCSATYYDNDSNYIFFGAWGSGGYWHYWYRPSIEIQEYNPPHYQIAATEVVIGGKKIISETREKISIRYNWYTKETFHLENGYWLKDNIEDLEGEYYKNRANALFSVAYGMNFYN